MSNLNKHDVTNKKPVTFGLGMGAAIGSAIGVAFGNLALGIGVGIVIGALIVLQQKKKQYNDE